MSTNDSEETGVTVVAVPTDQAQTVIDFIASLESEETDVSGHMLSRGAFGGIGGRSLATKQRTDTGCVQTTTGVGVDFKCSDSDTLTM